MPQENDGNNNGLGVVIMVNPYSTGCLIAKEMTLRGYDVCCVWTRGFSDDMKTHVPTAVGTLHYVATVDQQSTLAETVQAIKAAVAERPLVACLAGGEAGVDFADALSEHLQLKSNGTHIANRRDKKAQQELILSHGLRAVRQAGGTTLDDVQHFLQTETYPVVLKPNESAGSDGVKLCHTYEEAAEHFGVLMKSQMVNGGECPAVLCQEFLKGKEYVVDHVSCNGVHKTMMVWVYDKRPANGSAFVYFGCSAVPSDSPEANVLIPYVRGVLDALGIMHGPSHGEVIITDDGPCLVEMNCRARGGDGNWRPLAKALNGGYSQVEATVDAFLDEYEFQRLPDRPPAPFKSSGDEICLVNFSSGTVKAMPGYDMMRKLPSFVYLETWVKVGSAVKHTVDLVTNVGSIILMHPDNDVLQKDIGFIRYMQEANLLFEYEPSSIKLTRPNPADAAAKDDLLKQESFRLGNDRGFPGLHRRMSSARLGPHMIRHMSNDRPELRMMKKRMTTVDASKEVVIMVDPYSTGCLVAKEFMNRGFKVMALWTIGLNEEMKLHVPLSVGGPQGLKYYKNITQLESLPDTVEAVHKAAEPYRVVACLAGGEAGVDYADCLSEALKVRTNGTEIPNRRDKKIQQELCRKAGLRSVRQASGTKLAEVESFLQREPFPLVLKPTESAGSDGVKLCQTYDEAAEHFGVLMKSQLVNGGECPAVLCQEFLRGKEYVVDHVSRDGNHKTMMVWVYDKRAANGSAFVYYGSLPVDPNTPVARILIPYVRRVLDALKIKNGPTHAEVIMTNDGPCLVEMNVRANGGDGIWHPLAVALTGGYSQVEATVDAYVDSRQFMQNIPEKPPTPFRVTGQEVNLVSFAQGIVTDTSGFDELRAMPSFVYLETGIEPGVYVDYTVDLITAAGAAVVMHEDEEVVKRDMHRIREMEKQNMLFTVEAGGLNSRTFAPEPDATVMESTSRFDI